MIKSDLEVRLDDDHKFLKAMAEVRNHARAQVCLESVVPNLEACIYKICISRLRTISSVVIKIG